MSLEKSYPSMVQLRESYIHLRRNTVYDYVDLEGKTNHGKNIKTLITKLYRRMS